MFNKYQLTILFSILINSILIAQDNKVDGKGQRKGSWAIKYKEDAGYYDFLKKIPIVEQIVQSSNETNELKTAKYIELVEYKKGLKEGIFTLYDASGKIYSTRKVGDKLIWNGQKYEIYFIQKKSDQFGFIYSCSRFDKLKKINIQVNIDWAEVDNESNIDITKFPVVALGNYKAGKIDGELYIFKRIKIANSRDIENPTSIQQVQICTISFVNGTLKDQEIQLINERGLNKDNFVEINKIKYYPKIIFKNGVCQEQIDINPQNKDNYSYILRKIVKSKNGLINYRIDNSSNLIEVPKLLKRLIFQGNYSIEVLPLNDNQTFSDGTHSIYNLTAQTKDVDDTLNLSLMYRATYKNRVMHGSAKWLNGITILESNYTNGTLNGKEILRNKIGKTMIEANYKDGYLNGKYIVYHTTDSTDDLEHPTFVATDIKSIPLVGPLCVNRKNLSLIDYLESDGGYENMILTIPSAIKNKFVYSRFYSLESVINKFNEMGYKMFVKGDYKFFQANYVNGVIQGEFTCYQSNAVKLFNASVSECKLEKWVWYDKDSKIIYDDNMFYKEKLYKIKDNLDLQTSTIKCQWCSKSLIYKDSEVLSECSCIQKNGDPIGVILSRDERFCSKKCKAEAEKNCCIKEGHSY